MPNIKITGMSYYKVKKISKLLTSDLARVLLCPSDWITFVMPSYYQDVILGDGKIVKNTIFVEVDWFDRGQDIKDNVAKLINDTIYLNVGSKITCVNIVFNNLEKEDYYENGHHF